MLEVNEPPLAMSTINLSSILRGCHGRPTWTLRGAETRLCVFLVHVCLILRQPTNSSRAAQSTPDGGAYSPMPPRGSENRIDFCRSWTAARPTAPFSQRSGLHFAGEISGAIQKRSKTIGNMWIFSLSPPCVFQLEWMMLATFGTDIERPLLKKLLKPKEYGLFRKKGPPRDLNLAVEA